MQAPAPLHCAALYCVPLSLQLVDAQVTLATVPSPGNEHVALLPLLQDPLQVVPKPAQLPPCESSGCPEVSGVQTPRLMPTSHASHLPVHGLSQQYPSGAQLPDVHSGPLAQGVPFGFVPHEPAMQTAGDLQPVDVPVQLG